MSHRCPIRAFTIVELLVVVIILGILAAVTIPHYFKTDEDAGLAQLQHNLSVMRRLISLYAAEHNGRLPNIDGGGNKDSLGTNFKSRLKNKTDELGNIGTGKLGPYVRQGGWPKNSFADKGSRRKVKIDGGSPGTGPEGWHFNENTGRFSANTPDHKDL